MFNLFKKRNPVYIGLDVDGVLLPSGRVEPGNIYSPRHSVHGQGVLTRTGVQALHDIRELPVEVRWFTTWDEDVASHVFADVLCPPVHESITGALTEVFETSAENKAAIALDFAHRHPDAKIILLDDEVRVRDENLVTVPVDSRVGLVHETYLGVLDHLTAWGLHSPR